MKQKVMSFILGVCIFIVYIFGLAAFVNYFFTLPNSTVVLIASIVALLVCFVLAALTIRHIEYAFRNGTPDKGRAGILLIAVLFVVFLFGIESMFRSLFPLENTLVNIAATIAWFGVSIGLAIVARKKIEEWYQAG